LGKNVLLFKKSCKNLYEFMRKSSSPPRQGEALMSFTAKVKETREFFIATTDLGTKRDTYRDAHFPLDPKVFYAGHLFLDSLAGTSHYVNFQEATSAVFHGSELVEDHGEIRLVPFKRGAQ
jgi:hypothetical protein